MIRRNPTRIELKIEDIAEYNKLKAELEAKRATAKHNLLGSSPIVEAAPAYGRPDVAAVHDRIGYDPKPKLQ
jgi:anaphase-promoting complex subunit 12